MNIGKRNGMLSLALALLLPLALTSCGGGLGTTAGGGTGGTGVGPVTGFGSVIVNGVRYVDTGIDNTNFFDDHGRTKADLMSGMMVAIFGTINGTNGTADNIAVLRHVDGPMDDNGVNLATNRLKVMGQDIVVDTSTVFDNGIAKLADLRPLQGANVNHPELEVHGSADNNGIIHATFVHKWANNHVVGDNVQVRGTVAALNPAAKTFSIGRKTADYNVLGSIPAGVNNGSFVEAKGTLRVLDNVLVATSVKLEDATGGQPSGSRVEVEGYVNRVITQAAGSGSFELLGPNGVQTVTWTSGTTTPEGGVLSDIRAGVKVEVEGVRKPDKSLAATRIAFLKANNVRMKSFATSVTAVSLMVFGKTVKVNELTQYKDSNLKTFSQLDIAVNDNVQISAYLDNSTFPASIVATRVERIGAIAGTDHILQGPVVFIDPGGQSMTILGNPGIQGIPGINVNTFSPPVTKFLSADETEFATQADFFAAIAVGDIVKARGNPASPTASMNAGEVQIEPTIDN